MIDCLHKASFVSNLSLVILDFPLEMPEAEGAGGGRGQGQEGPDPPPPKILADQLTLSQPGRADYAPHITTGTPGFSDLPTAL